MALVFFLSCISINLTKTIWNIESINYIPLFGNNGVNLLGVGILGQRLRLYIFDLIIYHFRGVAAFDPPSEF